MKQHLQSHQIHYGKMLYGFLRIKLQVFIILQCKIFYDSFLWFIVNVTLNQSLSEDDFILGNTRVAGFYRVNYEPDNWDKIIKQLKIKKDVCPDYLVV